MTIERMSELPGEKLEAILSELEKEMAEIKESQIISGDNLRFTENSTNAVADWQGPLPRGGQFGNAGAKFLRVTATAKHSEVLFADIIFEARYPDGTLVYETDQKTKPFGQFFKRIIQPLPLVSNRTNQVEWLVGVTGTAGQTVSMKVYIVANDNVEVGAVEHV